MIFPFTKFRRGYYAFSGFLVVMALIAIIVFGLHMGIEFTGGSIIELNYKQARPDVEAIRTTLADLELGETIIQPYGASSVIIRMQNNSAETHQQLLDKLGQDKVEELRYEAIGPAIGKELSERAILLVALSLLAILLYIVFAFRNISWPRKPYEYGLVATLSLVHVLVITTGFVALINQLQGAQFSTPVLVALLTVAGYAVNDTVVIFDRIRENLKINKHLVFAQQIDAALTQTMTRSLNTGLSTLFVLVALLLFGGQTLTYFALTMIIGIMVGTYSSIFIAAPLLLSLPKLTRK